MTNGLVAGTRAARRTGDASIHCAEVEPRISDFVLPVAGGLRRRARHRYASLCSAPCSRRLMGLGGGEMAGLSTRMTDLPAKKSPAYEGRRGSP